MKYLVYLILFLFLTSCSEYGGICTDEFVSVDVEILDVNQNEIQFKEYRIIHENSNTDITDTLYEWTIGPASNKIVIEDDSTPYHLGLKKDETFTIQLIGYTDNTTVINEEYIIKNCNCHISLISGRTQIIVD